MEEDNVRLLEFPGVEDKMQGIIKVIGVEVVVAMPLGICITRALRA